MFQRAQAHLHIVFPARDRGTGLTCRSVTFLRKQNLLRRDSAVLSSKQHGHARLLLLVLYAWSVTLPAIQMVRAQTNLPIYTDHLVNGFQDWSWSRMHHLTNPSPVHSGAYSIAVSAAPWQAVALENSGFDEYRGGFLAAEWSNLVFWVNGGTGGGQRIQVYAVTGGVAAAATQLPALGADTWEQFVIPLTSLGVAAATNLNEFVFQLTAFGTTNVFYLDDIELTARMPPATVQVTVNAGQTIRVADARWFGLNTAVWDGYFDTPQSVSLLKELGVSLLRFPGGSLSDEYHWATDTSLNNTWRWVTSFDHFVHVATNVPAQAILTVNYGTGTPAEAAAWVRSANVTNHLAFKYWEIGNECYGTWETDSNTFPHDAYTYATRAAQYIQQMKAADPTIQIGVVAEPGEENGANGYTNHPATNLLTGEIHFGWTPVMLSTLKNLGVRPDFLIQHRYPEWTPAGGGSVADSDALLLQATGAWAGDAAELRREIAGYFGPTGTNIELCVTENNSDAGAQGRQSTSLVNALYYADSLGQLMQTEFNSFVWWDFRNGADLSGSFDPTLYGWRTNGDLGMVGGVTNRYPPFYAAKLMRRFVQAGDTILSASSDWLQLSAYAARHADGSLSLLVLNKNLTTPLEAQITLDSFEPDANATILSCGIPQDDAARSGLGAPDLAQTNAVVGVNFPYTFPPLSLTLFMLAPAAPRLTPLLRNSGQVVFRLYGQDGVPYRIENSTNLLDWTAVLTNTTAGGIWDFTNKVSRILPAQFWRASWQ